MKRIHTSLYMLAANLVVLIIVFVGCHSKDNTTTMSASFSDYTSYNNDVAFMKEFIDLVELTEPNGKGRIVVSAALQGRVMTSTSSGAEGRSYGWINRELFSSGDTLEHINAYGGEERFWLGPEGGQYSIFFKKGDEFNLDNWYTPRLIDLSPYEVIRRSPSNISFSKTATLRNYADFDFDLAIERTIDVLGSDAITSELGVEVSGELSSVAYRTTNTLSNVGNEDWRKETGLLSIWLLGMYNASPTTTVVIPFVAGSESDLGKPVTDDYFGKVPAARLIVKDNVIYFSGDANHRSKIGLAPSRAKNILGSYDSENKVLTIIKYNKPEGVSDYVNSLWKIQDNPYAGDVVNSYNDGPPTPGEKQLGRFYELETSSPALALKAGDEATHTQLTCHFEGDETHLDELAHALLGVSLDQISTAIGLD